jgi:heme iron utilization protein
MSAGEEARRYLRHYVSGVLSTLSKKLGGYPFGSVVPFVTDHAARTIVLISRLAEHTKNVAADSRVSLTVREPGDDPQENARLTLVGDAHALIEETGALKARYLRYFPAAARLFELGDFSLHAVAPKILRYIGGFGAIHWVSADSFAPPANALAQCEADIVAHMNEDHAQALIHYCRHFRKMTPSAVSMVGIDCDGFDLNADGRIVRFDFARTIVDAGSARMALKEMVAEARA